MALCVPQQLRRKDSGQKPAKAGAIGLAPPRTLVLKWVNVCPRLPDSRRGCYPRIVDRSAPPSARTIVNRRMSVEAYCLKCRQKREMQDEKKITMKNGKPATEGKCPVCSTRMFKIGSGK